MHIEPIAPPALHEKVLELALKLPGSTFLDVPTGYGALTAQLLAADKSVTAGDIDIKKFKANNGNSRLKLIHLDLNQFTLPLPEGAFDVVISVEGIEHLQSQWTFIRNIHRVLKPGGHLIITTPNILNIRSRLRYLMEGRYEHFKRPLVKGKSWIADIENYHISPISYFELQFMLESCGFSIDEVHTNKYKARNVFTRSLKFLFRTFYIHKNYRDSKRDRGNHSDLYRRILSDEVFFGECLILVCEKNQQ